MVRDDSPLDVWLDRLKETKLPALVEVPLSVLASLAVGILYGSIYHRHTVFLHKSRRHLPLMTEVPRNSAAEDAEKLYSLIMEQLELEGSFTEQDDERLIRRIRADASLRSQISLFMTTSPSSAKRELVLCQVLHRIWPRLLELPPVLDCLPGGPYAYQLSLILPAYQETNPRIAATLQHAYSASQYRHHECSGTNIQVIVVNAGGCCPQLQDYLHRHTSWSSAHLQVVTLDATDSATGGGRGRALNAGASHARGRVLFFLHSDTKTPLNWDGQILEVFPQSESRSCSSSRPTAHASCFRFAFDKSGLSSERDSDVKHVISSRPPPSYWALLPIKSMVNIRTQYFRLPYGDQGIAIPAPYFHYLGGFPEQPIMEDYSLMDFLRQRARFLQENNKERLAVLEGACEVSVRRWHKVGAVYMTLANALIVWRYNFCGWSPDDIFHYYYQRPFRQTRAKHAWGT